MGPDRGGGWLPGPGSPGLHGIGGLKDAAPDTLRYLLWRVPRPLGPRI